MTAPGRAWRVLGLALAAATLVCGIGGGLARLGLAPVFAAAAPDHAALMIGGFLATVISLERAVALGARWSLAAPLASACGAIAIATGHAALGAALWLFACAVFVAASIAIARRQLLVHTALLAVASLAWAAGTAIFVFASPQQAIAPWFAFLVLTIAAERLEMTRLMNRGAASRRLLLAAVAVLLLGAFASQLAFGAGLVAVAAWLAVFDIARRTLFTTGFARYSATALVAGYAWLAAGGAAWMLAHAGYPVSRDLALHAVGLGFVFSMIMAHGPVIIPAVARIRVRFTPLFYVPLALLHGSLAVRLIAGHADFELRRTGAAFNAIAIALFAAILVASARRPEPRGATARHTELSGDHP